MFDLLLDSDWDLKLTDDGDLTLAYSIPQAIKTRLLWIFEEWRLGPTFGFPWFEEVFVKNPDTDMILNTIRDTIMDVTGVTDCTVTLLSYSPKKRSIKFEYRATTDYEVFVEEVEYIV